MNPDSIRVEAVQVGPYQMNCYLVSNARTNEAFIVDPGAEPGRIAAALGERRPVAVLLTHGHYDHFGAADALCERYRIPLYVHEADAPKLTDPQTNASAALEPDAAGMVVVARTPPTLFHGEEDHAELAGIPVTVLHTPGHTGGGVCYLLPDGAGLLCGDTLFDGGYGRYDLPTGSFHELKESLRKLIHLSPRMVAYPGHGPQTMTGREADA